MEAHEIHTLVCAKIAQPWEIDQLWTLDDVFDTLDAMAEYADLATYGRPRPRPAPQRRQGPHGL